MQSLGKNSNSLDGLNAHLVVIDELHSIQDRNLYEVMKQVTVSTYTAFTNYDNDSWYTSWHNI